MYGFKEYQNDRWSGLQGHGFHLCKAEAKTKLIIRSNGVGCVRSTLSKGHPFEERFEEHIESCSVYQLHYARLSRCRCDQYSSLMESETEPASAGGCETYFDAVAVSDTAYRKESGARLQSYGAPDVLQFLKTSGAPASGPETPGAS